MLLVLGTITNFVWGGSRVPPKALFASKQHVKAYISAVASWIKAFILRLGPKPQAAADGLWGAQEVGSEGWIELASCLDVALIDLGAARSRGTYFADLQKEHFRDGSAYFRTAELNLLLWVSRAERNVTEVDPPACGRGAATHWGKQQQ